MKLNFVLLLVMLLSISGVSYSGTKKTDVYGPVKAKENLWSIAKLYQFEDSSMYKKSWAFFQINQHAFYENNMNRLKQGVYLKVPSTQAVSAIPLTATKQKVLRQIKEYEVFYQQYINKSVNKTIVKNNKTEQTVSEGVKEEVLSEADHSFASAPQINLTQLKKIKSQLKNDELKHARVTPAKKIKRIVPKDDDHDIRIVYSYDLSKSYDDNVRFAQLESDKRSDVLGLAIIKATTSIKFSQISRLKLSAQLSKEWYQVFNKLDHLDYSFDTAYIFSNEFKFNSPVYVAKLSLGGVESNSIMRTANVYSVGINRSERWSNRIHTTLGIKYKAQDSQSDVYDTQAASLFLNIDFSLANRSLLYSTYHYIDGDQVSSATPNLGVINASDAIEPDDAFGGVSSNQFAYKIDSSTHVLTLGLNKRATRKISLDVSARYINSQAKSDRAIKYERWIFTAGFLGRF